MIVYFSVLAMLGFLFALRNSNLVRYQRSKDALYFIAWIILFVVAAFRFNVGTDYKLYRYNYNYRYADTISELLSGDRSIGGGILTLLSQFIYDDYATWFFLSAAIAIIPCIFLVKKQSIAPCLSTVLFVVLCCWHTTFNIVMQCAAIGILALGYSFLLERKFFKWCFVCLLASTFHVTSLIMIPVYFLATTNVSWRRIVLLLVVGVTISVVYDELFSLMRLLSGEAMTESVDSTYGANQLNILRVVVHCAPPLLATALLKYHDLSDKKFCLLYNLSLFNAVLNIGTMNSAYLNRFALYTIFYNVLFIPYLVKPFNRKTRVWIWIGMLALYTIFWGYDLYKCSDTVVYHWIFERGA